MARAGNKGHRHCPEPNCEVCRATRLRYKKIADINEREQMELFYHKHDPNDWEAVIETSPLSNRKYYSYRRRKKECK